eukprot:2653130-Pleurochrysis_carterae.AAC.1
MWGTRRQHLDHIKSLRLAKPPLPLFIPSTPFPDIRRAITVCMRSATSTMSSSTGSVVIPASGLAS